MVALEVFHDKSQVEVDDTPGRCLQPEPVSRRVHNLLQLQPGVPSNEEGRQALHHSPLPATRWLEMGHDF